MALCPCLLDEDAKARLRISQAIDRELSQFKRENAREFKLLLLGASIVPMGEALVCRMWYSQIRRGAFTSC